ncbi:hypothetical protein GQ42DRAFT_128776 [Ramicandelaber brevisporus]|nr:hypothetical protein GQ42DRAFT_128776 [Ramicandelaber brevisporus]
MDSPLVVNSLFESHSYEELLQLVEQFGSGPPPNNQERIDGYLPVYFFKGDGKLELHTAPLHRKWPPEAVDSLETILHDQLYSIEQGCCICKVEYIEGDLLRGLPCRHGYHKDCIDRWLKSKNLCPLCRHDVVPTGWKVPEEASETAVTDSANTSPSS